MREGSSTTTRCAASCGSSTFDAAAAAAEGRHLTFRGAGRRAAADAAPTARVSQGAIEKSNVRGVVEMTRMIEVTRTYTQVASMLQQQGDMRRTAIEQLAEVPA